MGILDRILPSRVEARSVTPETEAYPVSGQAFFQYFGVDALMSNAAGVHVTIDTALGVPAVWAAVNFISGTLAGLPLHVYRKTAEGREKVSRGLATVLHDAVNDGMSSFEWRKAVFDAVLTGGRSFTYIERGLSGVVVNLWPLDPKDVRVIKENGRKVYIYTENGRTIRYEPAEIIDIPFMLKGNMIDHRGPIMTNADVIGLAIAATRYGARFFQNGGVPPFAVTGPFQAATAMNRAGDDLAEAVRKAAKEQRQALVLPLGLDIKALGADLARTQLVELQRFMIEQVARIYSLPPTFLQDLTHGTFSNTEQQDLHFVKHTIKRWAEQFEQELNLKLFGRANNRQYVELNVDGLLRGDFKTRMEGYALSIQNGIATPNEVRQRENMPDNPDGGRLMIQGATVPISAQPTEPPEPAPAPVADDRSVTVNVAPPEVRVDAPVVTVNVPEQRHEINVAPADVKVEPAPVTVNVPEQRKRKTRTVVREHDEQGRIKSFDQEEID